MSQITQSAVHCINPHCHRPYPQPWGNKFCNSCGAPLQLLDRYYPIQPLGVGGFAQIYTIWDEKVQTEKVLKVLVEDSPKALELFTQEAAVLSNFRHPGVPRVEADGYFQINLANPKPHQLACLVMEKINGQTLEEIRSNYPQGCPEDLVLSWFTQAVEILQQLHQRKIIHRDIKPSNLMLRNPASTAIKNQLVLIDFGGAKQFTNSMIRSASSSTRLYSSGYSPPEQVTGTNVSPVADFYALGRTIIELLTGKYPPDLEDPHTGELRWRHRRHVNPRLADLLDEMVCPDVKLRPASAAIIHKRLLKISPVSPPLQPTFTPKSQLRPSLQQTFTDLGQGISKTTVLIITAITKSLIACIATTWAITLSGFGSGIGAIAGFVLAERTNLGDQLQELLFHLINFLPNIPENYLGSEVVVFAIAGLGTAWGITVFRMFWSTTTIFRSISDGYN